jgi:hypothetical protein
MIFGLGCLQQLTQIALHPHFGREIALFMSPAILAKLLVKKGDALERITSYHVLSPPPIFVCEEEEIGHQRPWRSSWS